MSQLQQFLITTGRTLSQMALYTPDHPLVKGAVDDSLRLLNEVLIQDKELVLAIDGTKLIINGKTPDGVPDAALRPFLQLLKSHNLHSFSFLPGIVMGEMIPFFRLASSADMRKGNAAEFFASQNVTHIKLNEARYAKIGENDTIGKVDQVGPGDGGGNREHYDNLSLNEMLKKLIDKSVIDPGDRAHVFQRAINLVREQIDNAVEKVVIEFNREKMRMTNEQVRTEGVIGEMADGVVVVDENGKVLMMNASAEEIYGVKLGESLGRPLWEGIREEQMVALAKNLSVPTDRPLVKEVQILGTDEAKKTLRASSAAIQDTNGRVVGMVSVLSDVTKQKELTRMQNEFMANVTHDLRAPIHALKLAVNAILEGSAGPTSPEQQKMLSMATRNVDRLSRLIDDLLDFSKLESGKMDIRPQVIELEPLLKEAATSMESWSKNRGLTVVCDDLTTIPPVFADSDRLLQVINNLISNAIKFTPVGGRITLRARPLEEPGKQMVVVEIEDSGSGISKEDQERIFQRFVQLKPNEKFDIRGTGLGLSICRALIDLHKGKLWVQSPPPSKPNGSLFSFTIPAVQRSAAPVLRTPATAPTTAMSDASKKAGFWKKIFGGFKTAFVVLTLAASHVWARPYGGTVRRAIGADMIQLTDGTKVRYLGIIVPSHGSDYLPEATAANRAWVENQEVRFEYGLQERDRDGVWQAYVFTNDVFINQELVRQGLALVATLPNEESHLRGLIRAEKEAHDKRRGQWRDTTLELYPMRMRQSREKERERSAP